MVSAETILARQPSDRGGKYRLARVLYSKTPVRTINVNTLKDEMRSEIKLEGCFMNEVLPIVRLPVSADDCPSGIQADAKLIGSSCQPLLLNDLQKGGE